VRKKSSWRRVAAALAVTVVLASSAGVAQASTGRASEPSWIQWIVTEASQLWKLVAGGTQTDGGEEVINPKG
jgi:hypothetical protein